MPEKTETQGSPATSESARFTPTRHKRRNIVCLRGVLLVALGAILLESGAVAAGSAGLTLLVLHLLSNVLLLVLPLRLIRPLKFELVTGGTDVAFIAMTVHLSGGTGGVLLVTCLMMALVVALAGNRWHLACGAAAVVALLVAELVFVERSGS